MVTLTRKTFLFLLYFSFIFVLICTLPPILLHYIKSTLKYTRHPHGGTKPNQHPSNYGDDKNDNKKQQRRGIMTWYNIEYNYEYDHDCYPDSNKYLKSYDMYWAITVLPTSFTSTMKTPLLKNILPYLRVQTKITEIILGTH